MRIGITGSWKKKDQEFWSLLSNHDFFGEACYQLGKAAAESGAEITVGSESRSTADRYFVEGYLAVVHNTYDPGSHCIRVLYPQDKETPFVDLCQKYPYVFIYPPSEESSWRHLRQQIVSSIDSMITIGGGDGTYQVGLEMKLSRKRLVPIGAFGGASSRLLSDLLKSGGLRQPDLFNRLQNPWTNRSVADVMTVLRINEPAKILLIHGHAQDNIELQKWLRSEKLADTVLMAQEFTAGQTLPEKFESLAAHAEAAIALATPDDLASSVECTDLLKRRARQNVWVEVGWFWGRLGRERVLLLVRGDVEIPSDLEGIEYHRYDRSPVEIERKIRKFLLHVSQGN